MHPNIWTTHELFHYLGKSETTTAIEIEPGKVHWYPARPVGFASFWQRVRAAYLVFTGQADAVRWPFQ